jgi:hypothetical protein
MVARNIAIAIIILVLFFLIAIIAYFIFAGQELVARIFGGGGEESITDG